MKLREYIATHDNPLTNFIKFFFYKISNKYYSVSDIIKSTEKLDNGYLRVELRDGLVLFCAPSENKSEMQFSDRVKYGKASRLENIEDVDRYFFIYEILSELFVNNIHFEHFEPEPGDTVIDCGANIGGFTLQAAKKVGPEGRVIAIEPDRKNIETLNMAILENDFKNITVVEKGLWSEKKVLEFNISNRPGEHSLCAADVNRYENRTVKIEVDTLDNILDDLGVEDASFLKMDIEGAEIEAVKGAEKLLSKEDLIWIIEASHIVDGKPAYDKVLPFLKERGLNIYDFESEMRGTIVAKK